MFKTKTAKIIFFSLLCISLALNVFLIIAIKDMSDMKEAITDCAMRAQNETSSRNYISDTARKVASDRIYDQCLRERYGIDQRFQ